MKTLNFVKIINIPRLDAELRATLPSVLDGVRDTTDGCAVVLTDAATPADETTVANLVTAHNAGLSPVQAYSKAFLDNRAKIFNAYYTLHEGFRTASATPTIGEYRAVLGDALTIILTLPATFTDGFQHERAGLGGIAVLPDLPSSGWTLVHCQEWHRLLSGWLGRAMAGLAGAIAGTFMNGG